MIWRVIRAKRRAMVHTQPIPSIPFLLQRKLDEVRSRNASYSMRAFAKRLDIHPAALSEILNGKRSVSHKLASRLSLTLELTEEEREQILSLSSNPKILRGLGRKPKTKPTSTQLDLDKYFLVSEWYYYAILSLSETKGFKAKPDWIAGRLGLPPDVAKTALERLTRLGFFTALKNGKLVPQKDVRLSTTEDIASHSLKRRHESNLQTAQQAVRNVPVELREFTFMTMAIDIKKLPQAKSIIREFRERLSAFLEDGEKTEVYEFCLSLFPRTVVGTEN